MTQADVIKANKTMRYLTQGLFEPNIFLERVRAQVRYEQTIQDIIDGKIELKYNRG